MSYPRLNLGIENVAKQTFAVHIPVEEFTTEVHRHSRHQLLYAEGGVLHFFAGAKQFVLPARHAAWIPANLTHKVESRSSNLQLRTLYFWPDEGGQTLPQQLTIFPVTPLAREMIVYTRRWPRENPVSESEDAFYKAISYLVSDWCRDAISLVLPTTRHQLLGNITGYLIDNLDDDLTLTSVSREFGLSSRTMMRLFRSQLDMTFQEYLRTARVIAALELLSSPDATVTEVNQDKFVVLDKTAFYPNSGGQPHDTGFMKRDGEEFRVIYAGKFSGQISHQVEQPGLKVGDKVSCSIDWPRRYLFMRYHTAAHVISAVIHKETGAEITGNQIGEDRTRIDFALDEFDRDKLKEYEKKANEIIAELGRIERLKERQKISIANMLPQDADDLKVLFANEVVNLSEEDKKKILSIVKKFT